MIPVSLTPSDVSWDDAKEIRDQQTQMAINLRTAQHAKNPASDAEEPPQPKQFDALFEEAKHPCPEQQEETIWEAFDKLREEVAHLRRNRSTNRRQPGYKAGKRSKRGGRRRATRTARRKTPEASGCRTPNYFDVSRE